MSETMKDMTAVEALNHRDRAIDAIRYLYELDYADDDVNGSNHFFEKGDLVSARASTILGDELDVAKTTHGSVIEATLRDATQGEYNVKQIAFSSIKHPIAPLPEVEVRRDGYVHRFSPRYRKRAADIILKRVVNGVADMGHEHAGYFIREGQRMEAAQSNYQARRLLNQIFAE